MKLLYSSQGSEDYVSSPFNVPRANICKTINQEYRKYMMKEMSNASNFPSTDDADQDLCAMFEKKKYTIKDFNFNSDRVHKIIQAGWYKIQILIMHKGSSAIVNGIEIRTHLY